MFQTFFSRNTPRSASSSTTTTTTTTTSSSTTSTTTTTTTTTITWFCSFCLMFFFLAYYLQQEPSSFGDSLKKKKKRLLEITGKSPRNDLHHLPPTPGEGIGSCRIDFRLYGGGRDGWTVQLAGTSRVSWSEAGGWKRAAKMVWCGFFEIGFFW